MNVMKTDKLTIAGIAIIVLVLIAAGAIITNSRINRGLKNEKHQNEALISQKLQTSQDLNKTKNDLSALTSKNEATEKSLKTTQSSLALNEKKVVELNSTLKQDKIEMSKLQASYTELEKSYSDQKIETEAANKRIQDLENSSMLLDAEKRDLISKLENAEKYRSDNMEIYGSTGNKRDKITFMARRTKKLNISFEIPQSLTGKMSMKIVTPSGGFMIPENQYLSWSVRPYSSNMTAGLSGLQGEFEKSQKVMVTYMLPEKLTAGDYEIQIISDDKDIGNCRIRLR